jgi:hypothetical protein
MAGSSVCPGKLLGQNNIFIMVSTLLAVFKILPPDGEFEPPKFIADLGRHVASTLLAGTPHLYTLPAFPDPSSAACCLVQKR